MNKFLRSLHSLVLTSLISALLGTIAAQPATAGINRWTPFGPGGGTVVSLTVDPSAPKTLYAVVPDNSSSLSAIFKSTDGAVTWTRSWNGLPDFISTYYPPQTLALDPARPWTLYTAVCLWKTVQVFRSVDRGEHWVRQTPEAGLDNADSGISSRSFHLTVGGGPRGAVYLAMGTRLLRSSDRGAHWKVVLEAPAEILSLYVDPMAPWMIYAGMADGGGLWRSADYGSTFSALQGPPQVQALASNNAWGWDYHQVFAASGSTIYRGKGNDSSWTRQGEVGGLVTALAVDARSPLVVYAAHDRGIAVSQDGGATWTEASQGLPSVVRAGSDPPYSVVKILALAAHPAQPGTLYAGTELAGVYQTRDGGQRWQAGDQRGLNGTSLGPLLFDPFHPDTICTVEYGLGALWCSTNGGRSWAQRSTTLSRGFKISQAEFDPALPDSLYATASGESERNTLYRSVDGGVTWTRFADAELPFGDLAILERGVLLVSAPGGVSRSEDGGRSWTKVLSQAQLGGGVGGFGSIVLDPEDPAAVYVMARPSSTHGGDLLCRSLDAGRTWSVVLSGGDSMGMSVVPISGLPGTVYVVGYAWRTRWTWIARSVDGGDSWNNVTPPPNEAYVVGLAVDRLSPDTLYVGTPAHGVLRSTDGGATWGSTAELPQLSPYYTYTVFANPTAPHTFFAVADGGLFVAQFPPR